MALAFMVVGNIMTPAMLCLMNTPEEVFPESEAYLRIYFTGVSGLMFYNIGSGEEYRITNYEFEELLLGTLGLGSPKKLFDPHWFTTRNFHGQWYYDGDELEKYCHFRANIPVKEYFKSMMDKVEG